MEMIVDEMLAILNDRDAYVQKQIEKNRRIDLDDLFIRGFDIRWNEELQDSYVYQIRRLRILTILNLRVILHFS